MRITRLEVSNFRNLSSVAIEPGPGLNVFIGPNGAGKTALLEAVHMLCRGRSFRTQRSQSLIQHEQEQLVVRLVLEDELRGATTLAIAKDRNARTEMKLNGEPERRLSEIARITPVQVMLPDIADLVFGGPANRRSWLDWGTFHVKPDYLERLRSYLRAVKQRNTLLKDKADPVALGPWSEEVARLGREVTEDRETYLAAVESHFHQSLQALAPELKLEWRYQRGWQQGAELHKLLGESGPGEVKYGATQWGPHRADLVLRTEGQPVAAVLSRGQGKMVASALLIAQASLLMDQEQRSTVFLIDDAGAELDAAHSKRFFGLLEQIGGQVLATTTFYQGIAGSPGMESQDEDRQPDWQIEDGHARVFHVKHGAVQGN